MLVAPKRIVCEQGRAVADLTIHVVFTDIAHTLVALKKAAVLADGLHGNLHVLAPVVVPYPLDVDACPVQKNYMERNVRTVVGTSEIATSIEIIYCRDREQALLNGIPSGALIVLAWEKRWWWDETARLVKRLRKCGRQVVAV